MKKPKRAKRGRPKLDRVPFTTTLPPGYPERLRAIGHGSASAAIIWLVDRWEGDAHVAAAREND